METNPSLPNNKNVNLIYWLPFICFVLHTIEEIPGFAIWVAKHFKEYSTETFVFEHIPLIWLALATSYFATTTEKKVWKILAVAWQIQFGLNAFFHLTTTLLFDEYAPGLFVGVGINLPLTVYLLYQVIKFKLLSKTNLLIAFGIGILVAGLAIATLF
ncbi:MAG: HXXEE domain-containing protein [Saprospiraceae bacterium]|jgi:hypothetical protein|nr:HXXEE domain-containing protein [Saprospiraceae bacterium]